jgi:hypothetical protein
MKTRDIHAEIEEWMAGALCGGLSAEEHTLFDRHLAECEACRSLYREEQIMNTLLEKEMAGQRPEPEFAETMVRRFRENAGARRSRGMDWFAALGRLAWARPAQIAYALLLMVAMVKTGSVITGERNPMGEINSIQGEPTAVVDALTVPAQRQLDADDAPAGATQYGLKRDGLALGTETRAKAAMQPQAQGGAADVESAAPALPSTQTYLGRVTAASGNLQLSDVPVASIPAPATANALAFQDAKKTDVAAPAQEDQRKLIRNANVQFEVADYTRAADTITTLVAQDQGFVSTQNSDRGANGKMEGTIVVKVLPDHLDSFLMKLRVLGDLKNQTLTAEDVTKDYYDTDARMRNAQQEESRLLDILNKNTGKLSEILQVERELARVRSSIEEMQGTLKYYNTMVAYATVTIGLTEKDVNSPAAFLLKQRDDLSVYAANVDAAFAQAKAIATAAKAEVGMSNLARDENGNTTATMVLLIDPDGAEAAIAQLKGLGRIQNFTASVERVAQDGSGPSDTARTDRDKVETHLTISQDVETAAQQTSVNVQAQDVEGKVSQLKKAATDLGAKVTQASFSRDTDGTENGEVDLRMTLGNYPAVLAAAESLGDVKNLTVHRQEGATVSDSAPAEMTVQLFTEPKIIGPDNGVWAAVRRTLGEAFGAVMWSVRMIGVSLAFFAPWLLALGVVVLAVRVVRKLRGKAE